MIERVLLTAGLDALSIEESARLSAIAVSLAPEFPGALIMAGDEHDDLPELMVSTASWRRPNADLFAFDELFRWAARAERFALRIDTPRAPGARDAVIEILTRYQRMLPRTNEASGTALFARTLARHAELHDRTKPLVRADHDHALDTWQWLLRLDPAAGAPVQLAALFHDIERLVSEADVRTEHRAADYQAFKDAHAGIGAEITQAALVSLGWDEAVVQRAVDLVKDHERPGADPDRALLNDADALSFFSLNSWGFLAYYGASHTAMKILFTLRRMRPAARRRLRPVRYHPEVERMLDEALMAIALPDEDRATGSLS